MLTFHYCQLFQLKVEGLSTEKNIKSKLFDLSKTISINSVNNISRFGSDIFVLKSFSPLYRIIIQKETIRIDELNEKIIVFFVRDIFTKRDFEYTYAKVIAPSLAKNEWLSSNPLSKNDINDFINDYKIEKSEQNEERIHIPEHLTNWLSAFQIKINNEIYETEDWIHYSQSDSEASGMLDKYVNRFHLLLKSITSNSLNKGDIITQKSDFDIYAYTDDNYGVIYTQIYIDKEQRYILFNGANLTNQSTHWEEAKNKIINSNIQLQNELEFLSRLAYRAYPKWALKDENLWFSIQKSSEMSNLSLTQEQIFFLQEFKFPHYINGQAGSGKSTMLNYIFANVYIDKCLESIPGDIIYLTENENLIEDSKRCVIELLSNNPKMSGLDTQVISMITDKFSTFKKFLKGLLSEDDQIEYKDDKYLNYPLFKYLYENSYLPKHIINKYTSEECWFTIITYIYGYLPNKTITSNEYIALVPKQSQIIPKEKFEGIEKHVLPFYNSLISDEGYWDKLKIIRYIFSNEIEIPNYSVVICDEAQDFCKVELKFILKLSEFLNYDLSQIDQVPIVFAGDPNQTVNPTGFRESEITSMIFEELNDTAKFNLRRNESVYIPKYNYRSSKSVVSLANFIQFYRKKNLGIRLLFPQETKKLENDNLYNFNTFLSYENVRKNPGLKNDLLEKLKYKVFIVPVDAQMKDDYIQTFDLFQNGNSFEIKTSVEAKGTEYDQVVLFGFGEYFLSQFKELNHQDTDIDEQFKIRFFFNKLYVGITRARTELLIIDTFNSIQSFWKQLIEDANISEDSWSNLNSIKQEIIQYDPDSIGHIIKSTKEDAYKNAVCDRERGNYELNSARLKVAATQFIKLGFKKEGYECLANSEIILKRYIKAAKHYLNPIFENTKIDEAANCYFLGRHFKEMIEETSKMLNTPEQDVRLVIARLVSGNVIMKKDIDVLNKNRNALKQLIKELDWRSEIITALESNSKKINEKELKEQFVEILYEIANSKDYKLWLEIGEIYYDLRKFESAVNSWNVIDYYESEKYIISQIEIAKYKKDIENHILWLDELYKNTNEISYLNEIQELYSSHKSFRSTKSTYYFSILRSYLLNTKYTDIITLTGLLETYNEEGNLNYYYKELLNIENINSVIKLLFIERLSKATYKLHLTEHNNKWLMEFNSYYYQIAEKYKIPYIEYSITEIINIPDQIRQINIKPPSHFTCFKISNFRQFENISLENIGKYNLILGNNNVGKTSILETLLFTLPFEKYLQELGIAYIERTNLPRYRDSHGLDYYNINKNFILDFVNNNIANNDISFELINRRNVWHYKIEIVGEKFNKNLILENQQDFVLRLINDNIPEDISVSTIIEKIKYSKTTESPLIPYGKGFNNELADIYLTNIDKKKSEREDFIKCLQIFIPKIDRIIADTKTGQILIEELEKDIPIPLHQYGEGAIKLFRILLQIAVQKGKKILIDEIDSGIHYSNFSSFWKNIIQFCNIYDVQIFATTHNFECINYFKEILNDNEFEKYKEQSRIITLRQLPNKQIKAYTRVFDEFEYELDNNFEIRGGELL